MESIAKEKANLSSISQIHMPKKQLLKDSKNKDDIKYKIFLKTNLFTIEFAHELIEKIFLYGIDINQLHPIEEEKYPIKLMREARRKKEFHDVLNSIFESKTISGLVLFGKLKEDNIQNFYLIVEYDTEKDSTKSYLVKDKNEVKIDEKETKIIQLFTFTKRYSLLEYNKSQEKKDDDSQVVKNFLNICIARLLSKANYFKDKTTRKTIYYKWSENEDNVISLVDDKYGIDNFSPFSFPALKAICDIYEKNSIFLKLLPKNIVYSKNNFQDLYDYYMNNHNYSHEENFQKFREDCINKKAIKMYSGATTKIEDIEIKNPYQIEFLDSQGTKRNVGEYYKNQYNIHLFDKEIPFAIRFVDKGGKIQRENAQKLYIPCQCLYVVGNLFQKRINIKKLVERPFEKYKKILDVSKELKQVKQENSNDNLIETIISGNFKQKEIKAYKLKEPIIEFGNNIERKVEHNGSFDMINTVPYSNIKLQSIEIYLLGVNKQNGEFLYNQLIEAGSNLGIKLTSEPIVIPIPDDILDEALYNFLKEEMEKYKEYDKKKEISISFLFLSDKYKDRYKYFKRAFNDSERKIPTQVILFNDKREKEKDSNKLLSKFTNILCQVWGKRGDELYKCDFSFVDDILVIAYSCMRIKGNKIMTSLCASLNKKLCEYVFFSESVEAEKDMAIYAVNLNKILTNALESLGKIMKKKNKVCKNIIIYRDGVNERMMKFLNLNEKQMIIDSLKEVKDKIPGVFTDSKLCWIIVSKLNDIKLFVESNNTNYEYNVDNIPIGLVIDKEITDNYYYDFYLNSAFSGQGTNSATHYTVLYDDSDLTANQIYKLTYFLTFLSFNTTKCIKTPAPLYFVTRRNNFMRDHLNGNKINSKVKLFNVTL